MRKVGKKRTLPTPHTCSYRSFNYAKIFYEPIDPKLHYYVPRQELVVFAYQQVLGDNPNKQILALYHSFGTSSNWQNLDHARSFL